MGRLERAEPEGADTYQQPSFFGIGTEWPDEPNDNCNTLAQRENPTWGELRIWERLRRSGLGVRFRRQEPIGPYVADFACHARRLILEVDGITHHFGDDSYAEERDRWFRERGWEVIHFSDEDVGKHLGNVLATIRVFLGNRQ